MGITVTPALYEWAIERSGHDWQKVYRKFPDLSRWQTRAKQPTLQQLEEFAKYTYIPIGRFFSDVSPDETLPISKASMV